MRLEELIDKILKRWGERKLRKQILAYRKKLNEQERQGTEQTPSPTTK